MQNWRTKAKAPEPCDGRTEGQARAGCGTPVSWRSRCYVRMMFFIYLKVKHMYLTAANRNSQSTETDQSSEEGNFKIWSPTVRELAIRKIATNSCLVIENNSLSKNFAIRVARLQKPVIKLRDMDQPLPSDIWPQILCEMPIVTILDLAATCRKFWEQIGKPVSGQKTLPMLMALQGEYTRKKIYGILYNNEVLSDDKQVIQNVATLVDKNGYIMIYEMFNVKNPSFDPLFLAGLQSGEKIFFLKIEITGKCLDDIPLASLRNELKSIAALKIALRIRLSNPKIEDFKSIGVLLNDLKKDYATTALRSVWIEFIFERNECLSTSPEYLKIDGGLDNKMAADNVADLLAANHTLQTIDLSYAGVEYKNAKEIAMALNGHPSIRTADIRGNYVTTKGIAELKKAVSPNLSIMASEKAFSAPYDSQIKVRRHPVDIATRKAARHAARAVAKPTKVADRVCNWWLRGSDNRYKQDSKVSTSYHMNMHDIQLTSNEVQISKSSDNSED
jgi:hypothetical protein